MSEVRLYINGVEVNVPEGTSVAAAVMNAGHSALRRSTSGEPRAPLCGMGICYECCVEVNGEMHVRCCQMTCRAGMKIVAG